MTTIMVVCFVGMKKIVALPRWMLLLLVWTSLQASSLVATGANATAPSPVASPHQFTPSAPQSHTTPASDVPSTSPSLFGSPSSFTNVPTPVGTTTTAPAAPSTATSVPSHHPAATNHTNATTTSRPQAPTAAPHKPTASPTKKPFLLPTLVPSDTPSETPSARPSLATKAPSAPPTLEKTAKPTNIPTKQPSHSPSLAPTVEQNKTVLTAQVNVLLSPVNGTMDNATLMVFLETTTAFFNSSSTLATILDEIQVTALTQIYQPASTTRSRQRRRRQRYLSSSSSSSDGSVVVPLQVKGNPVAADTTSSTTNLNSTLSTLVKADGPTLLTNLQSTGKSYFQNVRTATATDSLPSPSPSPTPVPINSPTSPPSSNSKGLSTGVIIGIAVAAGVVVLVVLILFLIRRRSNSTLNRNTSDNVTFASMPMTVVGGPDDDNRRKSSSATVPQSTQDRYPPVIPPPPRSPSFYQQQQQASRQRRSTAASQSSMADTQSDYGSELMGTDNHSDRGDTAAGDTMSYTYSLDAGLTDTFEGTSTISGNASSSIQHHQHVPVPTSIPHITKSRDNNDDDDDDGIGLLDDDDELELGSVASSTLVGATGGNARVAEQYITRECWAPPGKLGIVIDTTLEGPVVHKVNPGSPLEGVVWPGDIIIAIDNVDTRAMSASAITQLMIKTAKQRRKLTILSDATK